MIEAMVCNLSRRLNEATYCCYVEVQHYILEMHIMSQDLSPRGSY